MTDTAVVETSDSPSQISLFGSANPAPAAKKKKKARRKRRVKKPKVLEPSYISAADKVTLRPFQQKVKDEINARIAQGYRRIGGYVAGGGGKTVISSDMIREAYEKISVQNGRCLFIVDRTSLIGQTAKKLLAAGVPCSTLQGDGDVPTGVPCIVASAQTIESRMKQPGATFESILGVIDGLIFCDEAHETLFRGIVYRVYNHFIKHYDAAMIAMTASPKRTSRKQWLDQRVEIGVEGPEIPFLVRKGYLCDAIYAGYGVNVDIASLELGEDDNDVPKSVARMLMGNDDYVVEQWFANCEEHKATAPSDAIDGRRRTVAFCASVEEAKSLAEAFNKAGVPAEWQDGTFTPDQRDEQDARLRSQETLVLTCCSTLVAGWDLPEISFVIYNRISISVNAFFQAAWRGDRVADWIDKQNFIFMDMGGNLPRLGWPMDPTDYYTGPPDIDDRVAGERDMNKTCFSCGTKLRIFAQSCECGYSFVNEDDEDDTEMAEMLKSQGMVQLISDNSAFLMLEFRRFKRAARKAGLPPGNAITEFKSSHGFSPPRVWHKGALLGKEPDRQRTNDLKAYFGKAAKASNVPDDDVADWIDIQFGLELGSD